MNGTLSTTLKSRHYRSCNLISVAGGSFNHKVRQRSHFFPQVSDIIIFLDPNVLLMQINTFTTWFL